MGAVQSQPREEKLMRRAGAVLANLLCVTMAGETAAQSACAPRTDIINHLSARYNEVPSGMGIANNGGVIELLSSVSGTSWTLIITMPNGTACMIAAGENWQAIPQLSKSIPAY